MKSSLGLAFTIIAWFEVAHAEIHQLKAVGLQLEVPDGYQVADTKEFKDKSALVLAKGQNGEIEPITIVALGLTDTTKAHLYNGAEKVLRTGAVQSRINDWDVYEKITKSEGKPDTRSYSAMCKFGEIGVIIALNTDAAIDAKVSAGRAEKLLLSVRKTEAGAGQLTFPAEKMIQQSPSMEPTIKRGEALEVDLDAYKSIAPARWDVIIFNSPISTSQLCSRIVGLPGEVIDLTQTGLTIDGHAPLPTKTLQLPAYKQPEKRVTLGPVTFPFTVPKDCYFVMGDNVNNSLDSRYWGGLDIKKILGKVSGK